MSDQTCRSCGAPIFWAETEQGKSMPVDKDPRPDGNLALWFRGNGTPNPKLIVRHYDERAEAQGANRYSSHFASCAQAGSWRKRP